MVIFVILIIVWLYNLLLSIYRFARIKTLKNYYYDWLMDKKIDFPTYKSEVIKLFIKAGVKKLYLPVTRDVGYGVLANYQADTFSNFASKQPEFVSGINDHFNEAIGYYRSMVRRCLNPLLLIESIVLMPKYLLQYIGLSEEKTNYKILNVCLTFVWWALGIFYFIYRDKIDTLVALTAQNFINIFS